MPAPGGLEVRVGRRGHGRNEYRASGWRPGLGDSEIRVALPGVKNLGRPRRVFRRDRAIELRAKGVS